MTPLEKAEGGHAKALEAESLVVDMKTKAKLPRRFHGACTARHRLGARGSCWNEGASQQATGAWGAGV